MVVMAIMAVLMGLSGGLMQKSINQQTRQVELEQIQQLFKKLSYQAYYGGTSILVRLEKNQMLITYPLLEMIVLENNTLSNDLNLNNNVMFDAKEAESNIQIEQIDFEQLTFVAQDYIVSTKGVISPNSYQVFWQQEIKEFNLNPLFNEHVL